MMNATGAAAVLLAAAAALLCGAGPWTAALLGVATAAAITDARERRIPNELSLLATTAGIGVWVSVGAPPVALAVFGLAAAVLYYLWEAELFGGGDVKFVPALVLAAAALGDPVTAVIRALIFTAVLLGIATVWAAASDESEGPLVVGGPLALALSITC